MSPLIGILKDETLLALSPSEPVLSCALGITLLGDGMPGVFIRSYQNLTNRL
jgi:hypothetical protein